MSITVFCYENGTHKSSVWNIINVHGIQIGFENNLETSYVWKCMHITNEIGDMICKLYVNLPYVIINITRICQLHDTMKLPWLIEKYYNYK